MDTEDAEDERQFDPEIMGFGFAPLSWQGPVGTVLVIVAYGKCLPPGYIRALVDFNTTRVGRVIQRDFEAGAPLSETIMELDLVHLIEHV
jgi:hypothetical protein